MSPNMKGMFGAVVISQPELDIVTVVNKNGNGQVVCMRFAIATPRDAPTPTFKVIAFSGKDFKNGTPRDLGQASSLIGAMALRESIIADYVQKSDEAKMQNIKFGSPRPNTVQASGGWSIAVPPFPGTPVR